ncbi:hypothetical protein GCM10023093_29340 [Nemorincola caseinilytica]|uniref:Transmembrane protein n=1 Tax=Nemorincola caseinilytica TaxID=2054315 RepID=A0ABP8NQC9_9BACT
MKQKTTFLYRNGLSIVLLLLMVVFWTSQAIAGWLDHNETLTELGAPALTLGQYLGSGHFASATFENWESEFLQMALYVILTVCLRQKGSAESKKTMDEEGAGEEDIDKEPQPKADAPWPVRRGGIWLKLYQNSLSIVFVLLFLGSFYLHLCGSLRDQNDELRLKGKPEKTVTEYLGDAHFWFESFQNWQSEFLAVASIVLLSVWLRQKGSPESKPVDAPHSQTGK